MTNTRWSRSQAGTRWALLVLLALAGCRSTSISATPDGGPRTIECDPGANGETDAWGSMIGVEVGEMVNAPVLGPRPLPGVAGKLVACRLMVTGSLVKHRMAERMFWELGPLGDCYSLQNEIAAAQVPPLWVTLEIDPSGKVSSARHWGGTSTIGRCVVDRMLDKKFNAQRLRGSGRATFLFLWSASE